MLPLIIALAACAVVITFLVVANNATPDVSRVPRRHRVVTTALPLPDTVLRLRTLAGQDKYRFALEDPQRQVFVLEEELSMWSYGSFYPCFVQAVEGGTQVTVGIQTKAPQYGPVVTRQLGKITAAVTTAIDGQVAAAD